MTSSNPHAWRIWIIHRREFHWTSDFRTALCGVTFNSRGYTEPLSVGCWTNLASSDACEACGQSLASLIEADEVAA